MADRFRSVQDEVDFDILSFIATRNKATRYDITPHGKTSRKSAIKELAPSSAKLRLERLERNEYLYSERERGGLRKRSYTLTIKGFLCFLAKVRKLDNNTDLLYQAVKLYGQILRYPVERRETLYGKEAVEAWRAAKKSGVEISKKPPHIMDETRVDLKPIFPLYYYEALLSDLGETPYFRSIINAARFAYAVVEKEEAADRFISMTEGHLPEWRQKYRESLSYKDYEEKTLVRDFELAFLNHVFGRIWPDLVKIVSLRFPHQQLFDDSKALLDEEIQKIDDERDRAKFIQDLALRHFNPNRVH